MRSMIQLLMGVKNILISFIFMNESLHTKVKTLKDEDFMLTRKVFGDIWQFIKQKMADPYEAFN